MSVLYRTDDDAIAWIDLDEPATRNALSDSLLDDLLEALATAKADESVRVIVLGSTHDRIFSAGGDLKAFADHAPAAHKYRGLDRFPKLFSALGALGKPVICAAGGDVLAGAFGLALACDLVIAKQGVRFGCPEITVGIFPFMISALIFRNVPRMAANELMLLGTSISAERAYELHIVNAVVSPGDFATTVAEWARRLSSRSPLLMRMGKDAIEATRDMSQTEALSALQAQLAIAFTTEDIHEGISAFLEKRQPVWRGR